MDSTGMISYSLIVPEADSCTVSGYGPYVAAPLAFNTRRRDSPETIFAKKLHEGQQMAKVQNGVETAENFNRLSMAHESYRRQMTDRQTDL